MHKGRDSVEGKRSNENGSIQIDSLLKGRVRVS